MLRLPQFVISLVTVWMQSWNNQTREGQFDVHSGMKSLLIGHSRSHQVLLGLMTILAEIENRSAIRSPL